MGGLQRTDVEEEQALPLLTPISTSPYHLGTYLIQQQHMMAQQERAPIDSPGNGLFPEVPPMKAPSLEFVYRLVAKMHPTDEYDIDNVQGTGVTRSISHIQSGVVRGPGIEGIVVENSGADWAERVHSKKVRFPLSLEDFILIFEDLLQAGRPVHHQDFRRTSYICAGPRLVQARPGDEFQR